MEKSWWHHLQQPRLSLSALADLASKRLKLRLDLGPSRGESDYVNSADDKYSDSGSGLAPLLLHLVFPRRGGVHRFPPPNNTNEPRCERPRPVQKATAWTVGLPLEFLTSSSSTNQHGQHARRR